MVQHRVSPDCGDGMAGDVYNRISHTTGSRDYWALDDLGECTNEDLRNGLEERGIDCSQVSHGLRGSLERVRLKLEKMHSRTERGFLIYEDIATPELRKFVAARGLEPKVNHSRKTGPYLKALLEKADEEAAFPRFEELPAELRVNVYEQYFKALKTKNASLPLLPPLTKVSRLLRNESLPLFYATCTFYQLVHSNGFHSLKLTPTQEAHITYIRHLQIDTITERYRGDGGRGGWFRLSLRIDLPSKGGAPLTHVTFLDRSDDTTPITPKGRWVQSRIDRTQKLLNEFVLRLTSRSTPPRTSSEISSTNEEIAPGLGLQRADFGFLLNILGSSHAYY